MINNGVIDIIKEMLKVEKKFRYSMKTEEAHWIKTIVKDFTEQLELGNINVAIDSFINYFYSEMSSLIEYLEDKDVIYIFDEPSRLTDRSETIEKEFRESMSNRLEKGYILPGQADVMHTYGQLIAMTSDKQRIVFTTLSQKIRNIDIKETFHIEAKNIVSYNSSFELLIKDLKDYRKKGYMGQIFTYEMKLLREKGCLVAPHTPAVLQSYFPFGHFPVADAAYLTCDGMCATKGNVTLTPVTELDSLFPLYTAFAKKYSGMVLRTKEDFLRKAADYAADGGKCAAYIRNNEIKGNAFYYKTETELTCVEAVADEKCYPMLMRGLRKEADGLVFYAKLPPEMKLPFA